jgi:hypothetical protein
VDGESGEGLKKVLRRGGKDGIFKRWVHPDFFTPSLNLARFGNFLNHLMANFQDF